MADLSGMSYCGKPQPISSERFPDFLECKVCVVLTVYKDQEAIFPSVKQFVAQKNVVVGSRVAIS